MRIVVLDGWTLNPGDLDWDGLEQLGECTVYDRTAPEDTVTRAEGAEIVLTNKTVLGGAELEQLPSLRYIGVLATGYNVVDLAVARRRGIVVTNVPAYSTQSVAEMVFALILAHCRHVAAHSEDVHEGGWTQCPDFCYWLSPMLELHGCVMGLVGLGRIGRAVARIARAFGMSVMGADPLAEDVPDWIARVTLERLFRESDFVSLHCPLTPDTEALVNGERLGFMKPTAFLVNTGRGPLVDEAALAAALNEGRIAGAGVDVLSREPPEPDNPLLTARNCVITPHVAWATYAARSRLMATAVANVNAFVRGEPENVVNG